MKTISAWAVVFALIFAPLASHADVAPETAPDTAIELTKLSSAELAARLRAMTPRERTEALESYRTYLENLDSALSRAENALRLDPNHHVQVTVAKTGVWFVIAGAVIAVPAYHMSSSVLVIVNFFGKGGLRLAAGTAGIGAILLAGVGLYAGAKAALNHHQIVLLRKSIAHIKEQISEIESLSAPK